MATRIIPRRSYSRRTKSGKISFVRSHFAEVKEAQADLKKRPFGHICRRCGAKVLTVPMSNGGWGHFEAEEGLTKFRHYCFYIGVGIYKRRDEKTLDLFDDFKELPSSSTQALVIDWKGHY